MAFYRTPFIQGEYHGPEAPADLAVRLALLVGVIQPSDAVG